MLKYIIWSSISNQHKTDFKIDTKMLGFLEIVTLVLCFHKEILNSTPACSVQNNKLCGMLLYAEHQNNNFNCLKAPGRKVGAKTPVSRSQGTGK
jgi:hypothetical protein